MYGTIEQRSNVISGCSLDQSTISSPCHQDVEIWKIYDSASDSLVYTAFGMALEMSGHTVSITANSDQDTVDNLLEMDGDYWTATTNESITGESTGYLLEITFDTE